ncbi:natterin-3 [Lates calcarifer]|uniref:Natterin-3 n=1 Tax=Lates calcarifer TaxID=8187 RepID=A0AAJ7PK99_LATCA|nr:natterin-3 [Lates calcarifer]
MMKLQVLILLAWLALLSARPGDCENSTEPEIENKLSQSTSFTFDQTNLKWETFGDFLPSGAISVYNGYAGRIDYVCKYGCEAGFYNPTMGPKCHYPYLEKEYLGSPFEILVNKDNFEFMEWKEGSYGSVPQNSVQTCSDKDKYVGKNKYGLGKVQVMHEAFFLPWEGKEYWYKTYEVLTFNKDIYSEHISDVKYNTDGVEILEYPPESMSKSAISNHECQSVTKTVTLSEATQVVQKWETSFSITLGVRSSITAQIPLIGSTGIEFSAETTVQFTKGTTHIESTTHSVSVEQVVPPNHSCSISMVAYKYKAVIPYTARLSRTYSNQETTWTSISGTYDSVQIREVRAVVDRCESIPDAQPCAQRSKPTAATGGVWHEI